MSDAPRRDLVLLSRARKALAEAKSIPEIKAVRDQGQAAIRWAKSRRDIGIEAQNDCAEIVLLAERRLGVMLAGMENHPPGPDPSHDVRDLPPKLSELGITYMQSHRWQLEALVPEEMFREWLNESRAAGGGYGAAG